MPKLDYLDVAIRKQKTKKQMKKILKTTPTTMLFEAKKKTYKINEISREKIKTILE